MMCTAIRDEMSNYHNKAFRKAGAQFMVQKPQYKSWDNLTSGFYSAIQFFSVLIKEWHTLPGKYPIIVDLLARQSRFVISSQLYYFIIILQIDFCLL